MLVELGAESARVWAPQTSQWPLVVGQRQPPWAREPSSWSIQPSSKGIPALVGHSHLLPANLLWETA